MSRLLIIVKKNFTLIFTGIILVLFATGNMNGVATLAQSAMLKTGAMNADVSEIDDPQNFDYNFSVTDLKGNGVSMEQFKGKVIFLNLWATWCGPCRAEMPTIQSLFNEVEHDKIAFIMLSLDKPNDREKVINYISKKAFSFPVYMDASSRPELLRVPSIPTTFVISKEGKVISQHVGTTNFNTKKFKKFLLEESSK
jgi:thiol-disulfide isomerase/thioredoxin